MNDDKESNSRTQLERQEDEYWFPYHYVTVFSAGRFRQHFVDTWGINYAATIEFIVQKIGSDCPSSVVDVGCGDGRLSREIFIRSSVKRVYGIDCSARAIALAKSMNRDIPGIEFRHMNIVAEKNLQKFDAAVLMEVLEHIPVEAVAEFIAAVRRLLKRGGKLYITVPHANKPVEDKHFQHFKCEDFVRHLGDGFDIVSVIPFERKGIRRYLMNMLLCNRFFVLNNQSALNYMYRWYKERLFHCSSEEVCQRIYIEAIAK